MNAQRSVWSPPPPTVRKKHEIYFGGTIDNPRYTENPLIHLWWTDEEMRRLAYRELSIPAGLLELLRRARRDRFPILTSVTQDNIALFLNVLGVIDEEVKALYIVCDPERVLRYGLVTLPTEAPTWDSSAFDPGSWTWDGETVWPVYWGEWSFEPLVRRNFVYACRIDTRTNSAGFLRTFFEGYYRVIANNVHERYYCQDAGWVATDPQAPNSLLANILHFFSFRDRRVDYTAQSKYLPNGPSPIFISGTTRLPHLPAAYLSMLSTFPVVPSALVLFEVGGWDPDWFFGTLYIVVGDRAVLQIPELTMTEDGYFRDYYQMTDTGLPYNLVVPWPYKETHRLLRCSSDRALVLIRDTWVFTGVRRENPFIDVLIEFDLKSGQAIKDIVVPTIRPQWGMEYNGVMLASPMMTSSKGRLKLP